VAGVIGYEPQKSGSPALFAAARRPPGVFWMCYFSWNEAHSVPLQLVGALSQQPTLMLFREQQFWGA